MQIEEFLEHVTSEPERAVTRTIWITPPEVFAKMAKKGPIPVTELLSAPGRRAEQRTFRYRHILGSPAPPAAIEAWQARHPSHPLPADLLALLACINGIHLWANPDTGRSYAGFAPIDEWEVARIKMYGPTADRSLLDDRHVALSYHDDWGAFVVLDVVSRRYFLMDTAGPDTKCPIASSADELLDWLWQDRMTPSHLDAKESEQ